MTSYLLNSLYFFSKKEKSNFENSEFCSASFSFRISFPLQEVKSISEAKNIDRYGFLKVFLKESFLFYFLN
tara:strand:+ start:401 stop:613 length:213 start_codon:yes stop_codon:yes gene_type:complete